MLDKTGQTGSPLQFVNGLILIITFAGARLVYGSIMVLYIRASRLLFRVVLPTSLTIITFLAPSHRPQTYQVLQTLFEVRDGLSSAVLAGYACGCTVLNGLNVFW